MPNFHRQWDEEAEDEPIETPKRDLADMEGLPDSVDILGFEVGKKPEKTPGSNGEAKDSPKSPNGTSSGSRKKPPTKRESTLQEQFEERVNRSKGRKTDTMEVWFAGAHTGKPSVGYVAELQLICLSSDVGGGSVPNQTRHSLCVHTIETWIPYSCHNIAHAFLYVGWFESVSSVTPESSSIWTC
jgi:hypothetical protein